jgi:hypothetical protein
VRVLSRVCVTSFVSVRSSVRVRSIVLSISGPETVLMSSNVAVLSIVGPGMVRSNVNVGPGKVFSSVCVGPGIVWITDTTFVRVKVVKIVDRYVEVEITVVPGTWVS